MTTLGRFHATAYHQVDKFESILYGLNHRVKRAEEFSFRELRDFRKSVGYIATLFNLSMPTGLDSEIRDIANKSFLGGAFVSITQSDLCPDNVIFSPDKDHRAYIYDFEFSEPRSVFVDATQLRMGMPGCGCKGLVPDSVLDEAEALYRKELMRTMPSAHNDTLYYRAYMESCTFRLLKVFENIKSVFLQHSSDASSSTSWVRRAMNDVLTRIETYENINRRHRMFPAISQFTTQMKEILLHVWGDAAKIVPQYIVFRADHYS